MDELEVRARAAEISMNYAAHITAAYITSGISLTEITPLAFVEDVERYIRIGVIPESIRVTKTEV